MERFLIDDGIKQSKIVANRYKWSAENADMGSEDANELHADICNQYVKEYEQIAEWLEELKSYKDLEEQGLLVRLPCKVGDTMYDIVGKPLRIVEHKVDAFHIDKKGFHLQIINGVLEKKQEAKVYFSREEAEKKLEKMKNEI